MRFQIRICSHGLASTIIKREANRTEAVFNSFRIKVSITGSPPFLREVLVVMINLGLDDHIVGEFMRGEACPRSAVPIDLLHSPDINYSYQRDSSYTCYRCPCV